MLKYYKSNIKPIWRILNKVLLNIILNILFNINIFSFEKRRK